MSEIPTADPTSSCQATEMAAVFSNPETTGALADWMVVHAVRKNPVSAWAAPWYQGEKQGDTSKITGLGSIIEQKDNELQ